MTITDRCLMPLSRSTALLAFTVIGLLGACSSDDAKQITDSGLDGGFVSDTATVVDVLGVSGDGGGTDSVQGDGATLQEIDCAGKVDGTVCREGSICLANVCIASSCGDGFVNAATNEACEDGNSANSDGCTNCRFDCRTDAECNDGNVCSGAETCDKSVAGRAMCKAGAAAANATICTLSGGGKGACSSGACVAPGCGNGVTDAGESCDDNNTDDRDGCTRECKFTCASNLDCNDGNLCNGAETCDMATHKCVAGTTVVCAASVGSCTSAGACTPSTGKCQYPDGDADGVTCNIDCNDGDKATHPGAFECKDGKDNDCVASTVDDAAPSCECYADSDKDGYAANGAEATPATGPCPTSATAIKPAGPSTIDCAPGNPVVHPAQTNYFAAAYCTGICLRAPILTFATINPVVVLPPLNSSSFDYNCNGTPEPQFTMLAEGSSCGANPFVCESRSGWVGGAVPACGGKGTYRHCTVNLPSSGGGQIVCAGREETNFTQTCR